MTKFSDLYDLTQVESPIWWAQSQICTQYMLGVRFVCACHLALKGPNCPVATLFWLDAMVVFDRIPLPPIIYPPREAGQRTDPLQTDLSTD